MIRRRMLRAYEEGVKLGTERAIIRAYGDRPVPMTVKREWSQYEEWAFRAGVVEGEQIIPEVTR